MNHQEMSYEESLSAADELIDLMRDHELELNGIMEPLLFPDGPPPALTVAEIMRAQARLLARSAQSMAEADIAYNAAVQKERGDDQPRASLISQEVAHKLALSAELENLVYSMAEEIEAKVAPKLFPNGLPPNMTLLGFLQSLRECLAKERARIDGSEGEDVDGDGGAGGDVNVAGAGGDGSAEGEGAGGAGDGSDGDGSDGDGDGDGEGGLAALHKTMNTIATIYSGFCDQASLDDLAEQVRSYSSLEED